MKCAKHMLFKVSRAGFLRSKAGDHGAELQLPAATVPDPRRLPSVVRMSRPKPSAISYQPYALIRMGACHVGQKRRE